MEGTRVSNPLTRVTAWATTRLILRSLRTHFRAVHLLERARPDPAHPAIVFANHHYWWDGYLAFLLSRHWRLRTGMVWMREWRSFPPFATLGAMPFPDDDMRRRITTVRRTMRALQTTPSVLLLFPERDLHPAPSLLPFQRALSWLHRQLPDVPLLPMAIRIVAGIHQYPEVFLATGDWFRAEEADESAWLEAARREVAQLLDALNVLPRSSPAPPQCILEGRPSINERWRCRARPPAQT